MSQSLRDLDLSERTNNGSFISDTISDEEVLMHTSKKSLRRKRRLKNQSSDDFYK